MLLSLEMIKRIESVKVEAQVIIRKISTGVQTMYEKFIINQHKKRTEKIDLIRIKKRRVMEQAYDTLDDLFDEQEKLQGEKNELFSVLNPFKGNLGGK